MKASSPNPQKRWLSWLLLEGIVAILAIASIPFDPSLHAFRYMGNALFVLLGLHCLSLGYTALRKAHQEGQNAVWYTQPLIRSGILFLVMALFSVCAFDVRPLVFR